MQRATQFLRCVAVAALAFVCAVSVSCSSAETPVGPPVAPPVDTTVVTPPPADTTVVTPPAASVGPLATATITGGDNQTGMVGANLPVALTARLADSSGRPIGNHAMTFAVVSGGGQLFLGTVLSNADGEVQDRWKLGTSTSTGQRVELRDIDPATGDFRVFAVFTATARPGPAASLTLAQPAGTTATPQGTFIGVGDTVRFSAAVADQYGNAIDPAAANVAWTSSSAGTALVDSTGLVTALASGSVTITARAGATQAQGNFTLTVEAYTYASFPVDESIDQIRVSPARGVATSTVVVNGVSVTRPWRWSLGKWVKDGLLTERLRSWCMSSAGLVAGIGSATLWISDAPGNWRSQPLPSGITSVTGISGIGCAGNEVILASITPTPRVFRLESAGWVDLQYPSDSTGALPEGLAVYPAPDGDVYIAYWGLGYAYRPTPPTIRRLTSTGWQPAAPDQVSGVDLQLGAVIGDADGYLYAAASESPYVNVARFGGGAATVTPVTGFDSRAMTPVVGPGGRVWGISSDMIAWPTATGTELHTLRDGRTASGASWVDVDGTLWIATPGAILAVRRTN